MQIKWVVFLAALWLGMSVVCAFCEGAYYANPGYGSRSGEMSKGEETTAVIESFMECDLFTSEGIAEKILGIADPKLLDSLKDMLTLDFAIFQGTWENVRILLLFPIMAGVIYTLAYSGMRLIRGGG